MAKIPILRIGSEELDLGPVHPQECEKCNQVQPFRLRLVYRYEYLYVVFGNVRRQSYLLVCEVCGSAWRIPAKIAWKLARLERHPIPFMRRFGCLLLLLVIITLALVSWLAEGKYNF
jgi:hypothetical protein